MKRIRTIFNHIQIIFIMCVMILLLPFNFLLTGRWHYKPEDKFYNRIYNWIHKQIDKL